VIGGNIAVEVESRGSKQVRGALVDLAFHGSPKKLVVIIPVYNSGSTAAQCRVILDRLCGGGVSQVVELQGSGNDPELYLESDVRSIRRAVRALRKSTGRTHMQAISEAPHSEQPSAALGIGAQSGTQLQ
jgi:hypothetical protein